MGQKQKLVITKKQAIYICHNIMGSTYIDKDNCLNNAMNLINEKMYETSNLSGREWYLLFQYLESEGFDLSVYDKK